MVSNTAPRFGTRRLVIVDDDELMHHAWDYWMGRLGAHDILHFRSAESFLAWAAALEREERDSFFFLVDYELGSDLTGLDLIEYLQLQRSAALVTGRAGDPELIHQCQTLKLPLHHKGDWSVAPKDCLPADTY
jgi:FixJ family two-component response regulator